MAQKLELRQTSLPMRIYLDCCCLQRPLDDQTHPRIRVETEAVLAILASVQNGDNILLGSEALEYELSRIPDEERRNEAMSLLSLAAERLVITEDMEKMTDSFEKEVGVVDTIRFLNQFRPGSGNYTVERESLFRDMTAQEIIAEIKSRRSDSA